MLDQPAVLLAGVGALALACQWAAWRLNAPSILFLLLAGLVVGPGLSLLNPDELLGDLLFPIVSLSVAVILFEGSLTLRFDQLRAMGSAVWRLLSIGVIVTWATVAAAAHYVVGLSWELALLFGAIMVVTGPTVIGPMLRAVRPTPRVANLLRWEGIVIDPLGAVLAILVFDVILARHTGAEVAGTLETIGLITAVGVAGGCLVGQLLGLALRNFWLPEYLHNVATLLVVIALFAVSDALVHESGLLAVTAMGIWLGNMRDVHTEDILDFKESLSLLLISGLFILLASRLQVATLLDIGGAALVLFLIVQFLVRPLKILVSTWPGSLSWPERGLLAWIAPRGIVAAAISSLFALRLEEINYPGAELIVPLTFALIIGTVVWQGLTAPFVARRLGVAQPASTGVLVVGGNPVALALAREFQTAGFAVTVVDSAWDNVRAARMAGLQTFFGNPVSEHADRRLSLTGLGYLFALSQRDELNALACLRFSYEFGRNAVYSLSNRQAGSRADRRAPARAHRGRELFGEQVTYPHLAELIAAGAELRQTSLTDTFDFEQLQERFPNLLPLAAWDDNQRLLMHTEGEAFGPRNGQTVLYLLPAADVATASGTESLAD